jgi:hypothetical protein
MIDLDLSRLAFKFAKTMPTTPHWYVVRSPANEADYVALFHTIQEHGVREKFGKRRYRYWYSGDWKYWAMTTDVRYSRIINRAKVADDPDGPDLSGYDPQFSSSTVEERRQSAIAEAAEAAAYKRQLQRREEKRQIAVIKAMQKAGLPIKRAVVEGVAVEFGRPELEPPGPFTEIETPEQLRRLI